MVLLVNSAGRFESVSVNEFSGERENDAAVKSVS
jgi:hypothetical protein